MARNATIGALRVSLGLDSAQFASGLRNAEGGIDKFGKAAKVAFAAVAAAGVTAAIALGHAVKSAADHADQLSKTAQKVGVTTEALSRLEWAAKLSDVSLETLSTGLRKLSQNLLDVAVGRGEQAETAFKALGISVTDAAGKLRNADAVLAEVAERFSRLEDGSTKTALAMALFGRSGSELIPLLNNGRDGLKAMADESDRLGQTISTQTGKAAEEFNDNLTRLNAVMGGIANRIMAESIPSLQALTSTFADPGFQNAIISTTNLFMGLADVLARTVQLAFELVNVLPKATGMSADKPPGWEQLNQQFGIGGGAASNDVGKGAGSFSDMLSKMGASSPVKSMVIDLEALSTTTKKAKEAIDPFAARMDELSGYLTQTHDPFEQMKLDLTDLKTMWEQGRISTEQYGEAVRRVNMTAAMSTMDSLAQITGALAGAFKDNKALAAANVVVSTAAGAMKAFEQGGILGFAGAAAIIAAGATQLQAILSAQPGSASMPSAPSNSVPEVSAPGQALNITFQGQGGGRQDAENFWNTIVETLGDQGKQIVVVPT